MRPATFLAPIAGIGVALLAGCAAPPLQTAAACPAVPALPAEMTGKPPVSNDSLVFQPGSWAWSGGNYAYEAGSWVPKQPSTLWMPAYWAAGPNGCVWVPAHWA